MAAYLIAGLIGIAMGSASALHLAGLWPGAKPLDFGNVEVAGWQSDFAIGSEAADPYTRARVARHGLLALAKSEAVYFTRTRDDEGQPLRDTCRYRISGAAMPAQWWSVTLYDQSSMLPMNSDRALSFDASRAGPDRWEAIIAAGPPPDESAWISSRNSGRFDLTLRLYVPDAALLNSPGETLEPPSVERIGCAADRNS